MTAETNINQEEEPLRIRITEEPLSAENFATIINNLTELHSKLWLVQQGRFSDLIEYSRDGDKVFAPEVKLVIADLTFHSPVEVEFGTVVLSPIIVSAAIKAIVQVFKIAIDAINKAPYKDKQEKLRAELLEKELKLKEERIEAVHNRSQVSAEQAELEKQKTLLELERQRLLMQIDIQKARLELDKERVDFALDLADKVVDRLYPEADEATRSMVARTLLPEFLELGRANGLELALPSAPDTTNTKQGQNIVAAPEI